MPKKGGKGKGKKKEQDWGEIVREQYVTIEVRAVTPLQISAVL
jgi:hypothetical protein|tara:strand:- start:293 stop:421 length:129 start_codon:yes stop_codon:yes gene_type:complete